MNQIGILAAAAAPEQAKPTYLFVWDQLQGAGLAIIVILVLISTCAWAVMAYKAKQLLMQLKSIVRLIVYHLALPVDALATATAAERTGAHRLCHNNTAPRVRLFVCSFSCGPVHTARGGRHP